MIYGLKVDLPALAGAKRIVEVPGLGTVVNPGTYEVPEELLLQFESTHGYPLEEANFQDGVELVRLPGTYARFELGDPPPIELQVHQDDPDAPKTGVTIEEKTQTETEAEFKKAEADNAAREAEKKEGDN